MPLGKTLLIGYAILSAICIPTHYVVTERMRDNNYNNPFCQRQPESRKNTVVRASRELSDTVSGIITNDSNSIIETK
jgi:hypothetical protein